MGSAERVGLVDLLTRAGGDAVAVRRADSRTVDPPGPHSGRTFWPQRVLAGPAVEVADDVHGARCRRPHCETCAAIAGLRPQLCVEPAMRAFPEEMQIQVRDHV